MRFRSFFHFLLSCTFPQTCSRTQVWLWTLLTFFQAHLSEYFCLFLGPALLSLHWLFGPLCASRASICTVLVWSASLLPTQQCEIAAWACTFQVRPPGRWTFASGHPMSQPTLGGFDLGILRRMPRLHFLISLWLRVKLAFCQKKNDIWGSCAFPNGAPLCDGAQHLIVLQRILFPKPPSPTSSPCFFPEVSGSACRCSNPGPWG